MTTEAVQDIEQLLARKRDLASRDVSADLAARLRELRTWQAARLANTYRDIRQDPRQAPAVDFFLSDLYCPHDFASRDREILRAWTFLKHSLPETTMRALGRAIELEVLTAELDYAMAGVLAPGPISETRYAKAYRAVGQRDSRQRQIDLVLGAGEDLDRAVQSAWIGTMLRAARRPAHAAGFGVLQDFLERGYTAFRGMKSARRLLDAIRERETAIMEAILSASADPFAVVHATAGNPNE